ncbi:MAG: DUF933 domain-containing protein [Desulfonauticus sp.]|nr:DUF933 domain-containing protein [Desulfonauticus sp.]
MKTAIFGFSGSGKTDLFLALAGPGGHNINRARVKVPEERLDPLKDLFNPPKVTYTEIEYLDIPGGGGKGGGLGARVLNEIRAYDCLLAVLDGFSGANNPAAQWQEIETDLLISDLAVVEKKLEKMAVDKKKAKNLVNPKEEELLSKIKEILEAEKPLREFQELAGDPILRGYCFLSAKPILYAWNVLEDNLDQIELPVSKEKEIHIAVSAKLEKEIAELNDPEEIQMFLEDLGLKESVLHRVIKNTYQLLDLITFLTAGEKEVRAWPLKKGSTAPEAAGVIHSDLQKGFIRAEVLSWGDFLKYKDFKVAKDKGALRLEGKDYIVQDGDIITFRFNV